MKITDFFTDSQKQQIQQAIAKAELRTSGEIRIHIDISCKEDVLDKAATVFHNLKMDATAQRNGVLFYLAVADKKFAILGDKGINEKVPVNFWDQIKEIMQEHFKRQQFTDGLMKGVEMAGEQLNRYFPILKDDKNELNDEISFGK